MSQVEVSNGAGWRFALKIALVVLPLFVVHGLAFAFWIGTLSERVTATEAATAANKTLIEEHGRDDGHTGALVVLNRNSEKIDAVRKAIDQLDDRLKRQWDEINRRTRP